MNKFLLFDLHTPYITTVAAKSNVGYGYSIPRTFLVKGKVVDYFYLCFSVESKAKTKL